MRSVMNPRFSQAPQATIPRSSFSRSHGHKTTFNAGQLVPIFYDEVLPGDTFRLRASLFSRMSTPIHPIMDNLFMETFFFFVPIRLIWDNWQKFNGEQMHPGDSTDYLVPGISESTYGYGSMSDYFGIPTGIPIKVPVAFYHRAYNLIFDEWFRSQDLTEYIHVEHGNGPDNPNWYHLQRRAKRHDYFTSCLPWPQKGPGVELPLGSTAPLEIYGSSPSTIDPIPSSTPIDRVLVTRESWLAGENRVVLSGIDFQEGGPQYPAQMDITGHTRVNLESATSATINSLRQAFQIQKLLERDARGGTRYIEILKSHFGVSSPDSRLQRPEYLGGSSTPIIINPVQQTSSTDSQPTPQGNLAAYGVAGDRFHGFTKSFVEHGVIIGLVNVRADLTYQQGLDRRFSRQTRWDYYWPAFAHLGEQAVLNKEIYYQNNEQDDEVFGYNERWAEYRYAPSRVTGKFRSNDPQSLDVWHLSQYFENLPTLSNQFIRDNPPISRVVAVQDEPHFIFDSYFDLRCVRPMPLYSVPGLIDHF